MTDFSKFQTVELTKPRDKAWKNWAKFEKVGDQVTGIIRDVFYRAADGEFREQRGFTLEQQNGELINVAIKREPYFVIRATDNAHLGDLLKVELTELRPSANKARKPTKIYSFTAGTLPENASQPTVKELELADMAAQNVAAETPATEEAGESKEDVPFE